MKLIEVNADSGHIDTVRSIAEKNEAADFRLGYKGSVLVGVMVAVALLPPTATLGLMLGAGQYEHAVGAGLLLAVNIVCVNLAAKIVFLAKGIHPRT